MNANFRSRLFCATMLAGAPCAALAQSHLYPGVPPDQYGNVANKNNYNPGLKFVGKNWPYAIGASIANSALSMRQQQIAVGQIHSMRVGFICGRNFSSTEILMTNPVFWNVAIEYPLGISNNGSLGAYLAPLFQKNGSPLIELEPNCGIVESEDRVVDIPLGGTFAVRSSVSAAEPPAASGALTAGGALAIGATYAKFTCVVGDAESAPSTEITLTTTTGTQSILWTLTAATSPNVNWLGCPVVGYYRGTAAGAEHLVEYVQEQASALANAAVSNNFSFSLLDTGLPAQPNAASFATAGQLPSRIYDGPNMWLDTAGDNRTINSTSGTLGFNQPGPNGAYTMPAPDYLLGDDRANPTLCSGIDSISYGSGVAAASTYNGYSPQQGNYFDYSTPSGQFNTANFGVSGTLEAQYDLLGGYYGAWGRSQMIRYCNNFYDEGGSNDAAAGLTWQQLAMMKVRRALAAHKDGVKYYTSPVIMRNNSTDNTLSLANQTKPAWETTFRVPFNQWVRNGFLMSNATTPCNTAGCGSAAPYIFGYFDSSKAIGEVNAAGVPTTDGGYWPVPCTVSPLTASDAGLSECAPIFAKGTFTGTPTTASLPYTISSGQTAVAHVYAEYVLVVTSGAAKGQSVVVADNTTTVFTASTIGSVPLSTAPASGDTFMLLPHATQEGIHPSLLMNIQMSTGVNLFTGSSGGYGFTPNFMPIFSQF